jgi:tetratricopeptide (TPR) repeat protein
MTEPNQESQWQPRKRYPGARPFTDSPEDQQIFFGREADVDRLFERVLASRLLVMFSKSGLGKTSLLMAGLFPKLRKEKALLPVPIRLNAPGTPADIVIEAVKQACQRPGVELTSGNTAGVWEFLLSSLIWSGDLLLTPLLVFDQFEEIFTLRDSAFRTTLASELGALVSALPPERLRTAEGGRSAHAARLGEHAPEVKILLSLREEYLGTLQEVSVHIPGLFQERFRLAPLGENEARVAICGPAERVAGPQDVPFATPPFTYDPDAMQELLRFLQGRSGVVESFQLQLLCCRAEEIIAARAKELMAAATRAAPPAAAGINDSDNTISAFRISRTDLGGPAGMQDVLRRFYQHAIGMLRWRDRRRARRLCEEGMVSATGSRIMLHEAQIQSDYGVRGPALKTLVNARLLRCEQRLESLFYEISHDQLAKSIEQSRPFRIPRKYRQMMYGALVVGLFTIAGLLYWNDQIQQARSEAEELVSFLIGENLLDKLRPVGRNAILEQVQKEVEAYLSKAQNRGVMTSVSPFLTNTLPQVGQLRIRGTALRNAGYILGAQGKTDQAIEKFRESAAIFKQLGATASLSVEMKAEEASSLYKLGDLLILNQGKITESLDAHRKALALRQELFDAGDHTADTTIDVAESYSAIGQVLNEMGRPRQALTYFDRARELLRAIEASAERSPQLLSVMHNAIDNRAASLGLLGDEEGARDAYAQATAVIEEWIEHHPFSADARGRHIVAISRQANDQMLLGQGSEAFAKYEQIHREVDELTRWDKTNAGWRRDFAATLVLKGEGLTANSRYDDAMSAHSNALEIFADLAEKDESNASLKKDLHWAYTSRGKLALQAEQWGQAIKDLTEAEKFIAAALGTTEGSALWQREQVWTYFHLAAAHGGENRFAQAADLLRRGRTKLESLIKTAPEMTVLARDLVMFYDEEILALERSGEATKATAVTEEKERFLAAATDPRLLDEAHLGDLSIGDRAKSENRLDAALAAYHRGRKKMERATQLEPQNAGWWQNLGKAHLKVAALEEASGDAAGAEVELHAAVKAGQRAVELGNSAEYVHQTGRAAQELGRFYERAKAPGKALLAYEIAGRNADLAAKLDPSNEFYFWSVSVVHREMGYLREGTGATKNARTDYDVAVKAGQRAIELKPNDGENWRALYLAQWFLAASTEHAGNASSAVVLLRDALKNAEKAAELMPDNQTVKKHVSDLRTLARRQSR